MKLLLTFLSIGIVASAEESVTSVRKIFEIQLPQSVSEAPACREYYTSCVRDSDCCSNNCTRDPSEPSFGYVCM